MSRISIKRNMIFNALLAISGIILPIITYPYVSRVLLPENMGKLSYVSSIVNYFQWFAYWGIPVYGIRKCAIIREDKDALSQLAAELSVLNYCSTGLSLIVLFIAVFSVSAFSDYKILFFVYSLNMVFSTLNLEWLYKGIEEYDYIAIRSLACRIFVVVITFVLIKKESDYVLYAVISVIGTFAIFIFNVLRAPKYVYLVWSKNLFKKAIRHFFPAFQFCIINIITTLYTNLDIVMLGGICGDIEVGYYSVATKVKTILVTLIASISAVLLPRMAQYLRDKKNLEFYMMADKVLNLITLISIPLVVFFMLEAGNCVNVLAGEDYTLAVVPMMILMPIVFVSGLSSTFGYQILVPAQKEKQFFIITMAGLGLDFVLNMLWIPDYGSTGAAMATLITEIFICLLEIVVLRSLLKQISLRRCILKTVLASSIAGVGVYLFSQALSFTVFGALVLSFGMFGVLWYTCMMILKEKMIREWTDIILIKIGRRKL